MKGKSNEIYNVGSKFEYKNIEITKMIAKMNMNFKIYLIYKDRPFNDYRYSVNFAKIKNLDGNRKLELRIKSQK